MNNNLEADIRHEAQVDPAFSEDGLASQSADMTLSEYRLEVIAAVACSGCNAMKTELCWHLGDAGGHAAGRVEYVHDDRSRDHHLRSLGRTE